MMSTAGCPGSLSRFANMPPVGSDAFKSISSLFCAGAKSIEASTSPAVPSVRLTFRSAATVRGAPCAIALPLAATLATWPPVTAEPSAMSGKLRAPIEMSTGSDDSAGAGAGSAVGGRRQPGQFHALRGNPLGVESRPEQGKWRPLHLDAVCGKPRSIRVRHNQTIQRQMAGPYAADAADRHLPVGRGGEIGYERGQVFPAVAGQASARRCAPAAKASSTSTV